mmetsp:Transcript_11603/g.38171  ORF Transcript_11603/g.38171 Transcript_11603/m.38171 type:complete len:420 (-) Transcript_11603:838-2097(-)
MAVPHQNVHRRLHRLLLLRLLLFLVLLCLCGFVRARERREQPGELVELEPRRGGELSHPPPHALVAHELALERGEPRLRERKEDEHGDGVPPARAERRERVRVAQAHEDFAHARLERPARARLEPERLRRSRECAAEDARRRRREVLLVHRRALARRELRSGGAGEVGPQLRRGPAVEEEVDGAEGGECLFEPHRRSVEGEEVVRVLLVLLRGVVRERRRRVTVVVAVGFGRARQLWLLRPSPPLRSFVDSVVTVVVVVVAVSHHTRARIDPHTRALAALLLSLRLALRSFLLLLRAPQLHLLNFRGGRLGTLHPAQTEANLARGEVRHRQLRHRLRRRRRSVATRAFALVAFRRRWPRVLGFDAERKHRRAHGVLWRPQPGRIHPRNSGRGGRVALRPCHLFRLFRRRLLDSFHSGGG